MMFFVIKARPMVMVAGAATLGAGLAVYALDKLLWSSAASRSEPSR
jgi:hypothetical protein